MTIFIGFRTILCVMRVFLSIDMLRNGINPVVALQPISPMGNLDYFQYLKKRSRWQNLIRKRTTVELCDGDTNIVVVKAKNAESIPELTKIAFCKSQKRQKRKPTIPAVIYPNSTK